MKFVIYGCTGRMGKELIKLILNSNDKIVGALTRDNHKLIDTDIGKLVGMDNYGIDIKSDLNIAKYADCIIDFSEARASIKMAIYATENNIPLAICTTGFDQNQLDFIKELSTRNKIFLSYNTSFGINIIKNIIEFAVPKLNDFDIEVIETHHTSKKDKPSGTAIMIRDSINKYTNKEINIESIREGDVKGEHKIIFKNNMEIIEFTHKSLDRSIYASGAIKAAKWLVNQPNGLYNMDNII